MKELYLTKRILNQVTNRAIKEARSNALEVAGSVVEVQNGWLVREYRDGKVIKIRQLKQ